MRTLKILTGKRIGKRLLGRPRHRWVDNIRIGRKEIRVNTNNGIDSTMGGEYRRAVLNTELDLRVS